MTTAGWIIMLCSVGSVTLLCVWTLSKVLRGHQPDHELGHVEPVNTDQVDDR